MIFVHFFIALIWFKAAPVLFSRLELTLVAALILAAISAGSGLAAQMASMRRVSDWATTQMHATGKIEGIPLAEMMRPYAIMLAASLFLAWLTLLGFDPRFWNSISFWPERAAFSGLIFSMPLLLHWVISSVLLAKAARG